MNLNDITMMSYSLYSSVAITLADVSRSSNLLFIENKIKGIFRVPSVSDGYNFMVLGAITIKFGMMKHKKMFSRVVKNFNFFFQVLLLFLKLKM